MRHVVRPTKRALTDLGIPIPTAGTMLHEIDDADISKMQTIPDSVACGSATPVQCITDRRWFRHKRAGVRGAVTELSKSVVPVEIRSEAWLGRWWLGAAGVRQDDTPQHDFYSCLKREVRNGSDHLLPKDWDVNRIRLELAYRSTKQLHDVVYRAIAASVRAGRPVRYEARNHYVQAQVDARTPDEIYLLIGACGVYDPKIVAVLLSAVPDVKADDWIPEPDSAHYGAKIEQGEVVYSTVITSDTLKAIIAKAIDLDD